MSLRAGTVRLRMRPPGTSTWTTVATSLATGRAVAVDDVKIGWGQPTPRDHPDPGTIAFTLLVDDDTGIDAQLLAYDTEVIIDAIFEHDLAGWVHVNYPLAPTFDTLARGWVTTWDRGRLRPDGRRPYRINAIDILGRAAATRLAATPWPSTHTAAQRVAAINAASVAGPLLATDASVTTADYDVDNAPALDVIRRHARLSTLTTETLAGITTVSRFTRRLQTTTAETITFPLARSDALPVPASIVEDSGRAMSRTSVVSEVAVTAYWAINAARSTRTYKDGGGSYSSSRYAADTDETILTPAPAYPFSIISPADVAMWASQLIKESAGAATQLPPARVLVDRPESSATLRDLFVLGRRHPQAIRLTGGPTDLDRIHYVTGGELTIRGRRITLSITTAPGRTSGLRSLRFADLSSATNRPRIKPSTDALGFPIRIADLYATVAPWPGTFLK